MLLARQADRDPPDTGKQIGAHQASSVTSAECGISVFRPRRTRLGGVQSTGRYPLYHPVDAGIRRYRPSSRLSVYRN